ncbi:hypothetical protein ScPMuIL_011197 [Solemya velum]
MTLHHKLKIILSHNILDFIASRYFWVAIVALVVCCHALMPYILGALCRTVMTMTASYVSGSHSMAFVTVPDMTVAKKLAGGLVKSKLAACVNIIPGITSVYEWEEEINEDSELLLMIKTSTEKVPELSKYVRENHPYDVAEVISSKRKTRVLNKTENHRAPKTGRLAIRSSPEQTKKWYSLRLHARHPIFGLAQGSVKHFA